MEEKLKIIDKYTLEHKEFIKKYFYENFFFTVSEFKEILDIFHEMETIKKLNCKELIENFEINTKNNKKLNGSLFYKYIKSIRYPLKTKYEKILKQKSSIIKDKSIKILYSHNLECGGIKMELNLENIEEFNRIFSKLNENKKEIKDLICIINSGDICVKK
ncbi:MAG: hypothetical protein GX287_07850 [Fusobacteria bacterium]|nr:hypothetical protein [Fusobacteriota bacterium]